MTVKELIRELQNVPEDAIIFADYHLHKIVKKIEYNDPQNIIYFCSNKIYESEDYEDNIPDDVDESNYNPYMDCDAPQENKNDNKRTRFILDSDGDTYHIMLTKEQTDFMDWCFKNCIDFSCAGAEEIKDVNWEMP